MTWFRRSSSQNTDSLESGLPTPENKLLFQSFEWHTKSQPPAPHETYSHDSHWSRLTRIIPSLAGLGVSSVWLPPGCKANNQHGNGYDCYDLWDLGEFDQKWARSSKWGSREELRDLLIAADQCGGVDLIWDAVLNHKSGGDATEQAWAVEVDPDDRRIEICPPRKIEAWLKFNFPGRENAGMKYSSLKWTAQHFNGTDWDHMAENNAIYKLIDDPTLATQPFQETNDQSISKSTQRPKQFSRFRRSFSKSSVGEPIPPVRVGKGWAEDVDKTRGNYDFLMFSNIYYEHPDVRNDVLRWGRWMVEDTGIHGFRLDAAQHFSWNFTKDWISQVQNASKSKHGKPALIMGEIWAGENTRQIRWLDTVSPPGPSSSVYAFDAPLFYNFSRISQDVWNKSPNTDLRTILTGPGNPEQRALAAVRPHQAVTMVSSHDTQPGQTSFAPMHARLKALFYAFILLRQEGLPCVFWGDLYGILGPNPEEPACQLLTQPVGSDTRSVLPSLMLARKLFAYGSQKDYFDSMTCIGWTRAGTHDRPGCVVLMSIAPSSEWASKRMKIGHPGETWVDLLCDDMSKSATVIDKRGFGIFTCRSTGAGVFVRDDAPRLGEFPVAFELNVYEQ